MNEIDKSQHRKDAERNVINRAYDLCLAQMGVVKESNGYIKPFPTEMKEIEEYLQKELQKAVRYLATALLKDARDFPLPLPEDENSGP